MSLRSYRRCGSTLSLFGVVRLASSLSVLDFNHFGSTLSVRSFTRLGSCLSAAGTVQLPNTMAFASNSYIYYDSGTPMMRWYMSGTQVMSMDSSGGTLHGTWYYETALTASDRRLKKDIKPLQRTLRDLLSPQVRDALPKTEPQPAQPAAPLAKTVKTEKEAPEAGALWMLRQLRPVSYYFKTGVESKYMRFGFIADELETVVPQVVRNTQQDGLQDTKGVAYNDLIALLTAAAQGQQQVIERQQDRMDKLLSDFASLKTELVNLKQEEFDLPNLRGKKKTKSGKGAKPRARADASAPAADANATNSSNATNLTNTSEPGGLGSRR